MARKKFTPEPFETIGNSKLSATIYATMLQSKAWKTLSNPAKVLYLYMKLQFYGQQPIEGHGPYCFYFNKTMYTKTYGLYCNGAQFQRDLTQLVENGFIQVVERGKTTRTKSIYRFCSDWQRL